MLDLVQVRNRSRDPDILLVAPEGRADGGPVLPALKVHRGAHALQLGLVEQEGGHVLVRHMHDEGRRLADDHGALALLHLRDLCHEALDDSLCGRLHGHGARRRHLNLRECSVEHLVERLLLEPLKVLGPLAHVELMPKLCLCALQSITVRAVHLSLFCW